MLKHSPQLRKLPWEKFYIKDTHKGPMVWEAKTAPIYLRRNGLPTRPHWLVVVRNVEQPAELKFFLANAPAGTPLEVLLHVAFCRAHVERCFEDEKSELGLSHFELRNYRGLCRHLTITALTHLFLAEVHQKWRGEKSGIDRLPASHREFGPGSLVVGVRTSAEKIFGKSSNLYYGDTNTQPASSPSPCEGQTPAFA